MWIDRGNRNLTDDAVDEDVSSLFWFSTKSNSRRTLGVFNVTMPICRTTSSPVSVMLKHTRHIPTLWIWRRMEEISWLDKVTNKEVCRRINEDRQTMNSIWLRKHRWIGHVLRHDKLFHEKAEWKVNQQEGEEFKCYTIWQMMMATLHSNGQLRTERDGNTEKGCQKPALQQKTTDVLGWQYICYLHCGPSCPLVWATDGHIITYLTLPCNRISPSAGGILLPTTK